MIKFIKGESEVNANNAKITLEKMVELGYNLKAKESTVMRFKLNDEVIIMVQEGVHMKQRKKVESLL